MHSCQYVIQYEGHSNSCTDIQSMRDAGRPYTPGCASLLLLLLYMPSPDSLQIVSHFLQESMVALFPVVQTLIFFWLTYTIVYLALACLNSRVSVTRITCEAPEIIGEFAPYSILKLALSWFIPVMTEKLLNLLRTGTPAQPATHWCPSAFPQLK